MTQPTQTTETTDDRSTTMAVAAFMIIPLTVLVLIAVMYNLVAAG